MTCLNLLRAFLAVGLLSQRKTCAGVVGSVTAAKINVPRGALTAVEELVLESRRGASNTSCSVICFDLDSVLICNLHSTRLRLLKERQLLTCNSVQAHYCHRVPVVRVFSLCLLHFRRVIAPAPHTSSERFTVSLTSVKKSPLPNSMDIDTNLPSLVRVYLVILVGRRGNAEVIFSRRIQSIACLSVRKTFSRDMLT